MKPSRSTVETLTDHVLKFETSRRADRARSLVRAMAAYPARVGLLDMAEALERTGIAHRELRRAARRLAKMALAQAAELRTAEAEGDALRTRIVRLEAEVDRLESAVDLFTKATEKFWEDADLPEEAEIAASHPTRTGRHDLYAEAMRLVGAKRSKGELVKLVNWLLHRAEGAKARTAR